MPEGDSMWTDRAGAARVAARTAIPILVADPASGRIGAAHAGWQGTRLRVAQALVRALVGAGSRASGIVASIGPSIGPCCYTVDAARAELVRASGQGAYLGAAPDGGAVFDLWAANVAQLRDLGVESIEVSRIFTRSGGTTSGLPGPERDGAGTHRLVGAADRDVRSEGTARSSAEGA